MMKSSYATGVGSCQLSHTRIFLFADDILLWSNRNGLLFIIGSCQLSDPQLASLNTSLHRPKWRGPSSAEKNGLENITNGVQISRMGIFPASLAAQNVGPLFGGA